MKKFCEYCNKKVDTTIKDVWETYQWKDSQFVINTKVRYCNCCGNQIFDERLDQKTLRRLKEMYQSRKEFEAYCKVLEENGIELPLL